MMSVRCSPGVPPAGTPQRIFGYASLVDGTGAGIPARLPGFRRVFCVAMDNARAIAGYKVYRERTGGRRPGVYVAFLDVVADPSATVNGLVRAVAEAELEELDQRERNYDRVEVTDRIEGVEGRVWTYRGSAAGRARLRRGRAEGRAVVARDYLERVRAGFAALGPAAERDFVASTDLDALPLADLERIDLPPPHLPGRGET